MPKCGDQDRRSHSDISWIVWSSSLGFESLDGIQVFIRRMQRCGNLCFNWEQMSSNKMPVGLSFVFGCVLVEWAFKFEVIFFEVDYRMSVQICFVLSGQWTADSSKDWVHRVQSTHSVSVTKTNHSMLYSEIIAVCSQIHTKHINSLCGQNAQFVLRSCVVTNEVNQTRHFVLSKSVFRSWSRYKFHPVTVPPSGDRNTKCAQEGTIKL